MGKHICKLLETLLKFSSEDVINIQEGMIVLFTKNLLKFQNRRPEQSHGASQASNPLPMLLQVTVTLKDEQLTYL